MVGFNSHKRTKNLASGYSKAAMLKTQLVRWIKEEIWARICKRLRRPGIESEDSISPAYVVWRVGTTNRVVVPARQAGNRFLGSLKSLQIRALAGTAALVVVCLICGSLIVHFSFPLSPSECQSNRKEKEKSLQEIQKYLFREEESWCLCLEGWAPFSPLLLASLPAFSSSSTPDPGRAGQRATCVTRSFFNKWTLYWKTDFCSPRNETTRPRSQFLHSCIYEQFIYS
jgi:hypothetical protein